MKKLAIFDLDGTLLNTIEDLATAVNYALNTNGFPGHDTESYKMFVGNGIEKLFERALPQGSKTQDNIVMIKRCFLNYYSNHCDDRTHPYVGVVQMLESLGRSGVMLAIASNKYHAATIDIVQKYFPHINFAVILGHREGKPTKPDPQIVLDILHETSIRPQDAIYIGDSGVDMQTGINSSVDAIGVSWGFRTVDELMQFSPQYIAHRAEDVTEIILKHTAC